MFQLFIVIGFDCFPQACPGKCEVNRDCVECKQFKTGLSLEQCDRCPYPVIAVDELPPGMMESYCNLNQN